MLFCSNSDSTLPLFLFLPSDVFKHFAPLFLFQSLLQLPFFVLHGQVVVTPTSHPIKRQNLNLVYAVVRNFAIR